MTRADNSHHLRDAAIDRHNDAVERATTAIANLNHNGCPVTFASVAEAGNVSRGWLYTQPAIRDTIASLRTGGARTSPNVPAAQRATAESLRQRLDTTHQDLTRLRAESQTLRDQLALALGEQRTR
jgi:hypothetical protein